MTEPTSASGYFRGGLPYNRLGQGPRIAVVFQGLQFENKPLTGPLASGTIGLYRFLETDYTVYLVGRRPGLPVGYTLRDMANDYATLIRQELGAPVDVIGLSTGGSIALHVAAEQPDLVRRLVLHSTAHTLGEAGRQTQRAVARLARQGRWQEASAVLLRTAFPSDRRYAGVAVVLGSRLMACDAPNDPSDLITTIEAEDQLDFRDRLGEIRAPTLVIAGERDPFYTPALFRETAAGIPNARLVLYPELGLPAAGPPFEREALAFLVAGEASPQVSGPVEAAGWRLAFRVGGVAALTTVLIALLDIVLSFLPGEQEIQPGRLTATEWFVRFRRSRFLALRDLGLWNIANSALGVPLALALYGAHRRTSRGTASVAVLLAAAGAAVYTANNRALGMLRLSERYAAASTDAERAALAAAGQAMLARGEDFTLGSFPGFLLTELAGLVMGLTVLRGQIFGRLAGWLGLTGSGLLLAFTVVATFVPTAARRAMLLAMGGGLLSLAWQLLTARRLWRLGRRSR